jgi:uncharacterized membrane protein YbhN (UPF0104 family)
LKEGIIKFTNSKYLTKARIFFLFKIIIALTLIYYLISFLKLKEITSPVGNANIFLIIIAFILLIPNIFLQFLKWKIFCNNFLDEKNNVKIFRSLLIGLAGGILIPYSVGEYMGRNIPLKDKPAVDVTLATLMDNFCHFLVIIFFGSFSVILFIKKYLLISSNILILLAVSLFLLFSILFVLMINTNIGGFLKTKMVRFKFFKRLFYESKILESFGKGLLLKIIFLSILLYICYTLQFALLMAAFSHQYYLLQFQWIGMLVIFSKTVIPAISFGDLGIRESAAIFFASHIGLSGGIGFNSAIFLFLINVLLPAIIGLFLMLKRN